MNPDFEVLTVDKVIVLKDGEQILGSFDSPEAIKELVLKLNFASDKVFGWPSSYNHDPIM